MMEEQDCGMETNGVKMNGSYRDGGSPPPFPHPEVILDTDLPAGVVNSLPKPGPGPGQAQELSYTSQCLQCSLCSMVLPSSSYLSHLRTFHRVSCPLNPASCPLCMSTVPIMDLTVHLASQHGLVPQAAVNALLLWVLTSNTFALNDSAQASLKSKFKGQQQSATTPPLHVSPKAAKPGPPPSSRNKPGPPARASPVVRPGPPGPKPEPGEPVLLNDLRGKVCKDLIK